jgi:bacterioferritin
VIRRRARADLGAGALTYDYGADREVVVRLLDRALAGELLAALRYRRDAIVASGLESRAAAAEFVAHAEQELSHADRLARRIVELGGQPDFAPDTLRARSYSEYRPAHSLEEMVRESLIAERAAVSFYRQSIHWCSDRDPTTRSLLEEILAVEERHAQDMLDLLPNGAVAGDGETS